MGISQAKFGTTTDGQNVTAYTLTNDKLSTTILNFGGIVTHLMVPDKTGTVGDVVLGFDRLADYEAPGPYLGALIGRVGNRIAKGKFTLDGKTYSLALNNGPNTLHGGLKGYDKRVWGAEAREGKDGPELVLTLVDVDGTEGYPGTVKITVTYTLTPSALRITYEATTDKATPINLTNHTYFNLKDAGASDVLSHVLELHAEKYTPVDDTLIPTGAIAPVEGTPIDFRKPKPIGRDLMAMGGDPAGYDHNLVLGNDGTLKLAAVVTEPVSGRRVEAWTTQPGVQFYSGNFLDDVKGKGGVVYNRRHGFCLETQHYPDSANQPAFPSSILRPGETYHESTEYRFSM